MRNRRFLLAVPAACLVTGLGAGAAYAYFTSSGDGAAAASVGSMKTVTLAAATATPATPLRPGGTGDVTLEVTNPNGFPVTLISVAKSGTITADGGHADCTTTGVTFTDIEASDDHVDVVFTDGERVTFTGKTALSTAISASSTVTVDLPGAVSMSAASSPGCQGATFSIPVTITAQK